MIALKIYVGKSKLSNIDFAFQVMIQPQNRHMSMSLYLASIAVVDTVVLILGVHLLSFIIFSAIPCITVFWK